MTEYQIEIAGRQLHRMFERAIGKSITKILTELITNSDDSYRRVLMRQSDNSIEDPAPILIVFDRTKKSFAVIDRAEGLTDDLMKEKFVTYGQESSDRSRGLRTRSLFGKGLRDVLFTQKYGQVKSIKNGAFYNCRFRWKNSAGKENPMVEIKPPSRVTSELRTALQIPINGTLVEFTLSPDIRLPQPEKLAESLSRAYMLRLLNSSPHREIKLVVVRNGKVTSEQQISYQFPKIEVQGRFDDSITTDIGTSITVETEIGIAASELTQGEVTKIDREGGLLIIDEDDTVLDLQLFGFDDEPFARKISGTVKLIGAGEYIRAKLNQAHPDEVLTETRDGFNPQHEFYQQLKNVLQARLHPIISRQRELGPKPKLELSEKTRKRHQSALDLLNDLANKMLGSTARIPVLPSHKRIPPEDGIAFVNSHISMCTGTVTPIALLVNTSMVLPQDTITIASENGDIIAEPATINCQKLEDDQSVALKIVRLKSDKADIKGQVVARWRDIEKIVEVTTTAREIMTPVNGIEFERDEYAVRMGHGRNLRLFVDVEKVPVGSEIALTADSDVALEIPSMQVTIKAEHLVTAGVAQVELPVRGKKLHDGLMVSASYAAYVAGTIVAVTKEKEPEKGRQGLFRGYKFQPLDRKLQTQWIVGWVLINSRDPVNARYFGDDIEKMGEMIEKNPDCQVLLAELMLNECLQIMVTQALDTARLDRHFPNNPEIDVRNYVEVQKFDIGANVHAQFAPLAGKHRRRLDDAPVDIN